MFIKKHNKTAIITADSEISYTALLQNIALFAGILGNQEGKRVVIISENRLEYIYAFYAIWKSGGIAVPVDFMSTPEEIAYIIDDCSPETVCFSGTVRENVMKALEISGKNQIKQDFFEEISDD